MSDIAIPGFDNNSNTAKQIENLMKAKRIPLEKMEIKQEEYTNLRGIWQDLNATFSKLGDSSKKLYGFENPFNEKSVISSNESILTADSERTAIDENMTFIVNKLATADKFVSRQLDEDTTIPRGNYTFSIGDDETVFKFRGGKLEDFVTKFNKKNPEEIRASLIKNSKTSQVLLIESLKTGKENSLVFKEDSVKLGLDLGLIQKNNVENRQMKVNDIIASKGLVKKNSHQLQLKPTSSASFRVNEDIDDNDVVEITLELRYTPNDEEDTLITDDLKVPSVTLENITIKSATGGGLERIKPAEESDTPPVLDMNIISLYNGKFTYNLDPLINKNNEKQVLNFSGEEFKNLKSINVVNNNTEKTVIVHSVVQKKGAGFGDYVPVKPITIARNASINMNGMDIQRDSNTIDDLVEGTTLYLHGEDPNEEVTLEIDFDTDYAKDHILDFVYNYNEVVKKIVLLTNDDKAVLSEIEFADDKAKEKAEEIHGLLKGDRTLSTIKQKLHRSITNAYPTTDDSDYKLLKEIGISTNATAGGEFNAAKLRGYIEADVEQLEKALENNIEGVKKLFGNDTNNDFIIDHGVGKVITDSLNAYTRSGGLISTRIKTIDSQMKRNEKEITDYKDDLVTYEETIRRKYGQMDATINTLNNSMKALDNLTNTGDK